MTINFGIIGCGKIAERHATLLSTGAVPGARLGAVCDLDQTRGKEFGRKYGVKFYSDYLEMMASFEINAVTVLTPSGAHAKIVEDIAVYKKPIVVEKPMALRLADADRMIAASEKFGARLFVVKQNRFNLPIIALKEAIDQGRLGKIVLGSVRVRWCRPQSYYNTASWRGTWLHDGGVLANQASHHIDLLEWMLGEADSVFAISSRALANIEAEDTAVASVKFRSGALGVIEATTATRPRDLEGSLSILGERGSVVIGGFSANELLTWNFTDQEQNDAQVFECRARNPIEPKAGYAHAQYYKHVVECIRNDSAALVDGVEGRKSLAILVALYESIETGCSVKIGGATPNCRLGY